MVVRTIQCRQCEQVYRYSATRVGVQTLQRHLPDVPCHHFYERFRERDFPMLDSETVGGDFGLFDRRDFDSVRSGELD